MNRIFFISFFSFTLLMAIALFCPAQNGEEYLPPMEIPIILSGNFGEIRSNHFHSGIDIKTLGREGLKVFAIKEGYVSRIKVSSYGFGKALYINHPNGITSVYAHLKSFSGKIAEYVENEQYNTESFEIELFPTPDLLPVSAGELIAYSGNTGGSGGPHLHFETRNKEQRALNPSNFGFYGEDSRAPIIEGLYLYETGRDIQKIMDCPPRRVGIIKNQNHYTVSDTLLVNMPFAIGISAYDLANLAENYLGIYEISLQVNGRLIFHRKMNDFAFHETRYSNAHIDHPYKHQSGKTILRLHRLPNDRLSVYNHLINDGFFDEGGNLQTNKAEINLIDDRGNSTFLSFYFRNSGIEKQKLHTVEPIPGTKLFKATEDNRYLTNELILRVPANALYEDIDFRYKREEPSTEDFGPIHSLHFQGIPLHKSCELGIRPGSLSASLYDKALILKQRGVRWESAGGAYRTGLVRTSISSFGKYKVGIDTIAPVIKPLLIDLSPSGSLSFRIADELSGIAKYRCTIDGKWILLEYEHKKNRLHGFMKKEFEGQNQKILLEVWDNKGNKAIWRGKSGN